MFDGYSWALLIMKLDIQVEVERSFAGNSVTGALVKKLIEGGVMHFDKLKEEMLSVNLAVVFPVTEMKYMNSSMVEAVFADIQNLRPQVKTLVLRLPQS